MSTTKGRKVLITGASRGLGRATAIAFAAQGNSVAVHYSTDEAEAGRTLAFLDGRGHVLVRGDLGDPEAARDVVADAVEQLGVIDVLVNNAAIGPTANNLHPTDSATFEAWESAWRQMLDVNVLGPATTTWAVARHLIQRGAPGAIVNVGSRGAFRGEPDYPAYGASKAALHAFTQSAAVALAPHNISVSAVAPGFIATDRQAEKLSGSSGEAIQRQSPFGRVGTPDEVAAAILYLASPAALWSSGAILDVNGASYLRT